MPTFQTSDNLTLYYEDDGNGVPVLCLAGLTRNCPGFRFPGPAYGPDPPGPHGLSRAGKIGL